MAHNDATDISSKNTKNEILEAYQDLLKKVSESKQMSHQEVKKKMDESDVVQKASGFTTEDMVNHLAKVKLSVCQSLDSLEGKDDGKKNQAKSE